MRRFLPLASIVCLAVSACGRAGSESETTVKSGGTAATNTPSEVAEIGDLLVGAPVRIKNLTVFPVTSKMLRDADRFVTLEEGLRAGTIEIFEVGAQLNTEPANREIAQAARETESEDSVAEELIVGRTSGQTVLYPAGNVNRLMVVNKSDKPLYLMPGEVIVGGYQDRTIADEAIIASNSKPAPIDVYCVEHGRWGGRASLVSAAILEQVGGGDSDDIAEAADKADNGKFFLTPGTLSKKSRLAAQSGEGQQAVWDNVAAVNASSRVESDSGAFTANFVDESVLEKLEPYLKSLREPIAGRERIIGVVVAINGKVEAVDVFESTPLFVKVWPRLLKGYALDAFHAAEAEGADKNCDVADARAFIDKVIQSQVDQTKESPNGLVVTRRNSNDVMGFSARSESSGDDAAMMGGMGMGGFGGAVHSAGFSK
jgi:hypothetical protein